jgi:hypothetical protein
MDVLDVSDFTSSPFLAIPPEPHIPPSTFLYCSFLLPFIPLYCCRNICATCCNAEEKAC